MTNLFPSRFFLLKAWIISCFIYADRRESCVSIKRKIVQVLIASSNTARHISSSSNSAFSQYDPILFFINSSLKNEATFSFTDKELMNTSLSCTLIFASGALLYSGIFRAILICLLTEERNFSSGKGLSR